MSCLFMVFTIGSISLSSGTSGRRWVGKKCRIKPNIVRSNYRVYPSNIVGIKNRVEIQIQRSYPLNSSISAQSTVRFGTTRIKVAAHQGRNQQSLSICTPIQTLYGFPPGRKAVYIHQPIQIPWQGKLVIL